MPDRLKPEEQQEIKRAGSSLSPDAHYRALLLHLERVDREVGALRCTVETFRDRGRTSLPSSPGAAQTDDDFTLSKNSLAREFFDCGYDGCTASQKVLIDSRYAQLTRASSPGAPQEQK